MRIYRLIAGNADLVVAGAAIDGAVVLGQERHLSLGATLSANHCMHLARGTLGTGSGAASGGAACRAAGRAATRLIHQTFLLVELLFTCCEYEIVSALTAP